MWGFKPGDKMIDVTIFSQSVTQAYLEKETPSSPKRSQTYGLLITWMFYNLIEFNAAHSFDYCWQNRIFFSEYACVSDSNNTVTYIKQ